MNQRDGRAVQLSPQEVQALFKRNMRRGPIPSLSACASVGIAIEIWAQRLTQPRQNVKTYPKAAKSARTLLDEIPLVLLDIEREAVRWEIAHRSDHGTAPVRILMSTLTEIQQGLEAILPTFAPTVPSVTPWHAFAATIADAIDRAVITIDQRRPFATKGASPMVNVVREVIQICGGGTHSADTVSSAIRQMRGRRKIPPHSPAFPWKSWSVRPY